MMELSWEEAENLRKEDKKVDRTQQRKRTIEMSVTWAVT